VYNLVRRSVPYEKQERWLRPVLQNAGEVGLPINLVELAMWEKRIQGVLYGRHCHVGERGRPGRIGGVRTATASYKGHRYPVEIINHCVWLYFRWSVSLLWALDASIVARPLSLRYAAAGGMAGVQAAFRYTARAGPAVKRRVVSALRALPAERAPAVTLEIQRQWSWAMSVHARTHGGHQLFVYVGSEGQVGYLATGRMTGEAGLLLAQHDATPERVGCLTPAVALGTNSVERLKHAHLRFSVDA
jgi:hypothetical protein